MWLPWRHIPLVYTADGSCPKNSPHLAHAVHAVTPGQTWPGCHCYCEVSNSNPAQEEVFMARQDTSFVRQIYLPDRVQVTSGELRSVVTRTAPVGNAAILTVCLRWMSLTRDCSRRCSTETSTLLIGSSPYAFPIGSERPAQSRRVNVRS